MQIGVDLGVPGLIAYVAMLFNVFVMLFLALRQRTAALDWTLAVGAFGGLLAMLIHGIFDAPVWSARPTFIPWLLIALSMLVSLRDAARAQPDNYQPIGIVPLAAVLTAPSVSEDERK